MLNQTARIISTYSADTFGVCSALFELGGMVVIHDPSGCNSTYTTHDEPRWYDHDSMIYVSALNEQDAILGNDTRFLDETIETVRQQQPAFVCLIASQIPFLIGTDMAALARIVEKKTDVPVFTLPTNNMHYYERGIYFALEKLAKHVAAVTKGKEKAWAPAGKTFQHLTTKAPSLTLNILGVTPQDFSVNGSEDTMHIWAKSHGFHVQSCWARKTSLAEIEQSGHVDVNLVVTYGGLGAARVLQKELGIPFVIGAPIGVMQTYLAKALPKTAEDKQTRCPFLRDAGQRDFLTEELDKAVLPHTEGSALHQASPSSLLIGESVYAQSLAEAIASATGHPFRVIVPMETEPCLLRRDTIRVIDEVDLEPLFAQAPSIIGDPMYQPILPKTSRFIPLPHEGFSGRLYERQIPNLIHADALQQFLTKI